MLDIFDVIFDVSTLSILIATISVVVGVFFAILELRSLVKTRKTDLILRLYSNLNSSEFHEVWRKVFTTEFRDFKDFNDYVKKGGMDSLKIGLFFEQLGVLLHRKLIDIGLVDDLFTSPINLTWKRIEPIAEGLRKKGGIPTAFEWFEHLYNEMQKREQKLQ